MFTLCAVWLPLLASAQPAAPVSGPDAAHPPLRRWSLGVTPLVVVAATSQQTGAAAHTLQGAAAHTLQLTAGPAFEGFSRYAFPRERWRADLSAGWGVYAAVRCDASAKQARVAALRWGPRARRCG